MIDEKSFIQRALRCYDNPQCLTVEEFKSDIDRFSLIRKIFNKYEDGCELNERLVLNHLVICFNLFGAETLPFLLFKIERKYWGTLFPFLILLNQLPDELTEPHLLSSEIPLDLNIISKLRNL